MLYIEKHFILIFSIFFSKISENKSKVKSFDEAS